MSSNASERELPPGGGTEEEEEQGGEDEAAGGRNASRTLLGSGVALTAPIAVSVLAAALRERDRAAISLIGTGGRAPLRGPSPRAALGDGR